MPYSASPSRTVRGTRTGRCWLSPGFPWYFAGSVISNFGTWLQNTAQVVLAYQLTHSVFWVGLVTCAQFSSPLVLGAWAGVLTRRFGNWRTLIVTQCASMVIAMMADCPAVRPRAHQRLADHRRAG